MLNVGFSIYYFIFGFVTKSWWLLTLGTYYMFLSVVRFFVLQSKENKNVVIRFTGTMLILLSVPLGGTVILSAMRDRGQKFHMIVMIAIAAYSFTKITVAIINFVKSHRSTSAKVTAQRNIAVADAFVSIFALQRSMLVTFEGMTESEILLFNIITGTVVWVIVLWLGIRLINNKTILKRN